ncbi:MAG: (Fe-S)-binding protein [Planctomycetota bacterium]
MSTLPGTGVTVQLFVPCYMDQLYPEVARATLTVLERLGCSVDYDPRVTCCGQPQSNSGCSRDAAQLARRFLDVYRGQRVVCPSGSCTSMIRHHYRELGMELSPEDEATMSNTRELCEFLTEDLGIEDCGARFPHRVVLHQSCHGLRELGLGAMSERRDGRMGAVERLLRQVCDLDLEFPTRRDECCGFGGTFSVSEAGLSVRMGEDRLRDLAGTGADYMCASDVSCLMHLDGLRRRGRPGPKPIHIAEILART